MSAKVNCSDFADINSLREVNLYFYFHVCLSWKVVEMLDIHIAAVIVFNYKEIKCFVFGILICIIGIAYWLYGLIRLMNNVYIVQKVVNFSSHLSQLNYISLMS